jgi:hypothetical protein
MEYLDKYDYLKTLLLEEIEIEGKNYRLEEEFDKFFVKGNKTAGKRIRKFMQLIRRTAEDIRGDVQDYKKDLY